MSSDSGGPSDTGANGAAIDMAAIEKMIADGVGKALAARLPRVKNTEETIAKMVADSMAKVMADFKPADAKPEPVADGNVEKLSPTRALQEKFDTEIKAMRTAMEGERKARVDAEQRAEDTAARAELRSKLTAKMGADNPLVDTVMDSLYVAQKRVVRSDGRLVMKFKGQYGDEEMKPLDEGVDALFAGELKSLVQQSRAGNMPPSSLVRGQQVQGAQRQAPRNAIYDEIASSISTTRPDIAALLTSNTNPQK